MIQSQLPSTPPANDAGGAEEIRVQLRRDHDRALAELESLRDEADPKRCEARLRELRQAWIIHALAEETVVYRALEGVAASALSGGRSDERFVEHELVGGLFEKLARTPAGSHEWHARLSVVKDLIARHIEGEHAEMFGQLTQRFGDDELRDMGQRFELARRKLTLLERAKAA